MSRAQGGLVKAALVRARGGLAGSRRLAVRASAASYRGFRRFVAKAPLVALTAVLLVGLVLLALLSREGRNGARSLQSVVLFKTPPLVRVLLTEASAQGDVTVRSDGDLEVVSEDAPPYRGTPGRDGLGVRIREGRLLVGGRAHDGVVRLRPLAAGPLKILRRSYPGTLVLMKDGETVDVVNETPLEEYVEGVLPGEMRLALFPDEALMAQAVVARSYAVAELCSRPVAPYHLRDDESSQVYLGRADPTGKARKLVERTEGLVLWYDGKPLRAYYMSTCGGRTRAAKEAFGEDDIAPYRGVECAFCSGSPAYTWTFKAPLADLREKFKVPPEVAVASIGTRLASGWVKDVVFGDGGSAVRVPVKRLISTFGPHQMKSGWIEAVVLDAGKAVFSGRGFGHGAGLCQWGARGLAERGVACDEILLHYFPGAGLVRLKR